MSTIMKDELDLNYITEDYGYICEHGRCVNEATVEYSRIDEEDLIMGEDALYINFKCDQHPEKDPRFVARRLEVLNGRY